jgi:NADPH:quinone reductase-like Zn-dependent oxidoreductase
VIGSLALAPFVPPRVASPDVLGCPSKREALTMLTDLVGDGKLAPVIDRCHPFEDLQAAVSYQEAGHAAGKVVLAV